MSRFLTKLSTGQMWIANASLKTREILEKDFAVYLDAISSSEHDLLVEEALLALKKMSWSCDHFDSVIVNFREATIANLDRFPTLNDICRKFIVPTFFPNGAPLDPHILELAPHGYINPHLDHVSALYSLEITFSIVDLVLLEFL